MKYKMKYIYIYVYRYIDEIVGYPRQNEKRL